MDLRYGKSVMRFSLIGREDQTVLSIVSAVYYFTSHAHNFQESQFSGRTIKKKTIIKELTAFSDISSRIQSPKANIAEKMPVDLVVRRHIETIQNGGWKSRHATVQ